MIGRQDHSAARRFRQRLAYRHKKARLAEAQPQLLHTLLAQEAQES